MLNLNIIKSVTMLFGYMGVLASFHWSLLVAMALFVVPAFMIHFKLGFKRYLNIFQLTPIHRQLMHMRNLMRDKTTIQEMKVYRNGGYLLRVWSGLYWKQADEQHKLAKKEAKNDVYIEGTSVLCISGITALFIAMGHTGKMSIGNFAALTQAVLSAQTTLKSIALDSGKIFEEILMVEHLFELLELTDHTSEEETALPLQQGIDVRNVFYKYPNSERHVLNNISFQIQAGERVAVVGDNGAGKSTLVKCLIGLYPVADGAIHYDGALLKSGQAVPRVTTLFQNFVRYNLTVRENIGMSNVECLSDELMIRSAAELATAGQFIEQLPESYNALLGNLFTGGNELSGGQWQKIALSRALFRNSDIVVLDEPTASLDPLTEASLIDSLLEHTGGKTVIIVTHRLSCCKIADRILVLKDGTLVEQGNHEQLMMQNSYYAQMYHSQAKWYVQV